MSQLHVVLLGDSILDNASYVPDEPAVIDQVQSALPAGAGATLLATDGAVTQNVTGQLANLPADATHLVLSVGGNDALLSQGVFLESPSRLASRLTETFQQFRERYRNMLDRVITRGRPLAVCTIYDLLPDCTDQERMALALFNDAIIREAVRLHLPVLDLRQVCDQKADYASMSPIEPSAIGGAKIARAISNLVSAHDFQAGRTVIYS